MKPKKILILELMDNSIKFCRLTIGKKRKTVDYIDAVELTHNAGSRDISEIFSKFSKTKYEKIIISLSRTLFLMRFLELPSRQKEELVKMLPFQLSKVVPYPLGEIIYDFSLAEVKEAYSEIIIFLIHRKKIDAVLDAAEKARVNIDMITMTSRGLWQLLIYKNRLSDVADSAAVILLDIDKNSAEFLVAAKRGIMFSRSFSYSGNRLLLEGIRQSLLIFEKKFGRREFAKVFFTGIRNNEIIEKINLGEAVFIDASENVSVEKKTKETIAGSSFSFASILGVTINFDSDKFEFSPKSLKRKRGITEKKKRYLKAATVIFEIILIFAVFLFKYTFDRHSYREFLDLKLEEIKVEAKELDEAADKLRVLDKKFKNTASFSEIIYGVISALDDAVELTFFDFQENGDFSLKGYADNHSRAFDLEASLSKLKFFKDVKIKYVSTVKQKQKTRAEFLILGNFK